MVSDMIFFGLCAEGYSPYAPYSPNFGNYYGGAGNTYVSNVNTVNNYYGPVNNNAPVYSSPGAHNRECIERAAM